MAGEGLLWSAKLPARGGHRAAVSQACQHLRAQAYQDVHDEIARFYPHALENLECLTRASASQGVEFLQSRRQSRRALCVVDRTTALESFSQQVFIEHLLCTRHCSSLSPNSHETCVGEMGLEPRSSNF